MVKYKCFITNIGKEEAWIESYTNQGYRLIKARYGFYQFVKCGNTNFVPKVKLDFRAFYKKEEYADYIFMFEDSGWRHIAGTKSGGCQYFEQMRENSADSIFSDNESKAERYKRISMMWLFLVIAYIPLFVSLSTTGNFDIRKLFDFKSLYLTPGLWEMTGRDFWIAFLIETPFALGRGFAGLIVLTFVLLYAYFWIKSLYMYRKERKC